MGLLGKTYKAFKESKGLARFKRKATSVTGGAFNTTEKDLRMAGIRKTKDGIAVGTNIPAASRLLAGKTGFILTDVEKQMIKKASRRRDSALTKFGRTSSEFKKMDKILKGSIKRLQGRKHRRAATTVTAATGKYYALSSIFGSEDK